MITVGSLHQSDLPNLPNGAHEEHEHEDVIASSIPYSRFHYLYNHISDDSSIPLVRCTQLSSNVDHLKVVGAIPYVDELSVGNIPTDAVVFSGCDEKGRKMPFWFDPRRSESVHYLA